VNSRTFLDSVTYWSVDLNHFGDRTCTIFDRVYEKFPDLLELSERPILNGLPKKAEGWEVPGYLRTIYETSINNPRQLILCEPRKLDDMLDVIGSKYNFVFLELDTEASYYYIPKIKSEFILKFPLNHIDGLSFRNPENPNLTVLIILVAQMDY
jgi:hypothetical protein